MTAGQIRARRGRKARRDGRRSELLCALWLMAKGYRILGLRLKTPQAEIDLLASKGDLLAVIEVKSRTSLDAALDAVTPRQRQRLLNAARSIAARHPDLSHSAIRLDLMALAPGRWPRHIHDAWRDV
jgi:putative endonuclease